MGLESGVYFVDLLNHPQCKYVSELFQVCPDHICVVFGDQGCGAIDCISEASEKLHVPTVLLDARNEGLPSSIIDSLSSLKLRSRSLRFVLRVADRRLRLGDQPNSSFFHRYLESLPSESILGLAESVLHNADSSPSCSLILRLQLLSDLSATDLDLLTTLRKRCPTMMVFLTCLQGPLSSHEEVPEHSLPLYVTNSAWVSFVAAASPRLVASLAGGAGGSNSQGRLCR